MSPVLSDAHLNQVLDRLAEVTAEDHGDLPLWETHRYRIVHRLGDGSFAILQDELAARDIVSALRYWRLRILRQALTDLPWTDAATQRETTSP